LRVLAPLDETPQAQRALLYAGSLAGATNGCLKLLRASDTEDETSFNSLDGSSVAEQGLGSAIRFAELVPGDLVLLRVVDAGGDEPAADEYLRRTLARLEAVLPERQVTRRITPGSPAEAIVQAATDLAVDAIAMSTHGRSRFRHTVLDSTATATLEHATVPVLVVGPQALRTPTSTQIAIGAAVHTLDGQRVGEVHLVVLDLDQQAVTSIVVLGRGPLARDVLGPSTSLNRYATTKSSCGSAGPSSTSSPDFVYTEFVTPPPTWTAFAPGPNGPSLLPARQRTRLDAAQQDITPGTRVFAFDGAIGSVDRVELEPASGQLDALWLRGEGIFAHDMRIPAEWVKRDDPQPILRVAATRADIDTYLGHESRARLGR
jgi:nucleotide-binding universal stress UspA family protein/sporulation protein YlmC with PRC-barrel domain